MSCSEWANSALSPGTFDPCFKVCNIEEVGILSRLNIDTIFHGLDTLFQHSNRSMEKSAGTNAHPCWTPFVTSNALEIPPLPVAFTFISVLKD